MTDAYFVVIACPKTGKAVRTGLWLRALAAFEVVEIAEASVQCPHCAGRHEWGKGDAWLERSMRATGGQGVLPAAARPDGAAPRRSTLGPDDVNAPRLDDGPDDV